MLAALVALAALGFAGLSLVRLSRLPKAPPPVPEDRTFATLRAGDVVMTPDGEWLVESRAQADGHDLFALRSGRERRWLAVPPQGALRLADEPSATSGKPLDRSTVELLPGA